ncbi:MAG TPA: NAD(P)H-dependent oxidoreductase [Gemmatimonadaceae bacterium]|jgi:NAD(P)H-dependent FMN reductase
MSDQQNCAVNFLIFGASLSSTSLNARLADLAAKTVESRGSGVDRANMSDFDCPSYDLDIEKESGIPLGATRLRDRLKSVDGFIISSPEYNASLPGVLKNAIDWVSRFHPQPFKGKQGLLMSASPSMVGGNRGLWALRVPLEHLGARVYPDMFSLAQAHQAFAGDGKIADGKLQGFFETTIGCFIDLVEATKNYPVLKTQWIEFLGERTTPATERVETDTAQAA